MIYFSVKSFPNSANPSGISRYKIRKNNPLHFQHLQNSFDLFILKPPKPPLESTLTSHLSLTPVQSTLTKNRGRGVVLVPLAKNSRNFVYPGRLSRGASLILAPVLSLTDDCGLRTDDCLMTDNCFPARLPLAMTTLSRRTILKSAITGAAAASVPSLAGAMTTSSVRSSSDDLKVTPRKGRIQQSVSRWCYQKIELDELCKRSAGMGLT